jgi:hypothetical protein
MRLVTKSAVICALASLLALPAAAQMNQPDATSGQPMAAPEGQTIGTVTNGNTTIEFQSAASNQDIDNQALATWGNFADAHPRIAHTLAYKPSLINDSGYLHRHPELADFFNSNPQIKDAMAENPGNFVAIPPRPGE